MLRKPKMGNRFFYNSRLLAWTRYEVGLSLLLSLLFFGCSKSIDSTSGESHFLTRCDNTCRGELQCISNLCTRKCTANTRDCRDLSTVASCTSEGTGSDPVMVCDVACHSNADCRSVNKGFTCSNGFCRGPVIDAGGPTTDAGVSAADCPAPRSVSADVGCTDAIVYARNPASGTCCYYSNGCGPPIGWSQFGSPEACTTGVEQ
jgi:hypothetical protein